MKLEFVHPWDVTPREAIAIQQELRGRIVIEGAPMELSLVAGVDVGSYKKGTSTAAAVVMTYPSLEVVEQRTATLEVGFPYVPGLLSFRETPVIAAALEQIHSKPDLILVDGHGYAHPRRFGIACHIGLLAGIPTIGVAKSKLVGVFQEPGEEAGSMRDLVDDEEQIGVILRTRDRVRPIFVSPGHLVGFEAAARLAYSCVRDCRLPEPVRLADILVRGSGVQVTKDNRVRRRK